MFNFLLGPFKAKTTKQLMDKERTEAEQDLLAHQSAAEYHQSQVSYNTARITRLQSMVIAEDVKTESQF